MAEKFRWGVIGPGRIAQKFARDVQATEHSELYAVASRSGAHAFVREFNVQTSYDSYEALVNDPIVDGVYIATPHSFHYENARLSLMAGKPVLCEKPLAVNVAQAERLIELSHQRQVFLMEALWTRFLPLYQKIRKLLDEQAIGEVLSMQSAFGFVSHGSEKDRWLNPDLAGGTLLDLGIYPIAISQWMMGADPVGVQAQAVLSFTGVDVLLAANLQYASGAISQFTTSFIHKAKNQFSIYGSNGSVTIMEPFWGGVEAVVEINGQKNVLEEPFRSGGFEYQIEDAVRCIRAGMLECPRMSHADTLANARLMDSIRHQVGVTYPFEE